MKDTIDRQEAIDALRTCYDTEAITHTNGNEYIDYDQALDLINTLPSAQPERLTDDDFETIRIHLSAFKESLCNQRRWKEAEDYERLISRFISFASAQPERKKGRWRKGVCECGYDWAKDAPISSVPNFCPQCGADMRGEQE